MSQIPSAPKTQSQLIEWLQRISRRAANKNLYVAQDSVGNGAGVLTTLHSYTLSAPPSSYFWKGEGQFIRITSRGSFAANANVKTLNIKLGTASFPFSAAINSGDYWSVTEVWKADISTIRIKGIMWTNNAAYPVIISGIGVAAAGVRLGEGAVIKSEGNGAGASDVTEDYFRVEWFPSFDSY